MFANDPGVSSTSPEPGVRHHWRHSETGVGTGDATGSLDIVKAMTVFDFFQKILALRTPLTFP